jgi:hypothetical protein
MAVLKVSPFSSLAASISFFDCFSSCTEKKKKNANDETKEKKEKKRNFAHFDEFVECVVHDAVNNQLQIGRVLVRYKKCVQQKKSFVVGFVVRRKKTNKNGKHEEKTPTIEGFRVERCEYVFWSNVDLQVFVHQLPNNSNVVWSTMSPFCLLAFFVFVVFFTSSAFVEQGREERQLFGLFREARKRGQKLVHLAERQCASLFGFSCFFQELQRENGVGFSYCGEKKKKEKKKEKKRTS